MKISSALRRSQIRKIYELLAESFRITITDISEEIGIDRSTAGNRTNEAFDKGYILEPNVRKKSYSPFVEYIYFVDCKDPLRLYLEYGEDERITYHAVMEGFANLWVISKEEIDIEGNVLISGPRSDYHVAVAPDRSWNTAIKIMDEKIEKFDPDKYEPKGTLQTHWDEPIEWDEKDEILFRYFKYDLRKPVTPLIRGFSVASEKFKSWLRKLSECCTVFTRYFPETIEAYDSYIFVFETDYEDFIIDLFSELPTSSMFFKVSNKLVVYASIDRRLTRNVKMQVTDVSKLHIPLLVRSLLKKGIVKSEVHAIVAYHWGKSI